jgi:hypothetical protein
MDTLLNFKFSAFLRSINKHWLQIGIVIAVLMTSMLISFWGSQSVFLVLLFLLGGLAFTLVLLRQPNLGFILVIAGGMLVPFRGPSGLNAATVMIALMLGLWLLDMFIVQRNVKFIHSPIMLPAIVFLVISLLSFLLGQVPWFVFARQAPLNAQVGGLSIFIFSIGGMFLSANLIKDIRWLKIIVWTFIGLATPYILSSALNLNAISRLYHSGFTAQSMFWTWLVALACGQIVFNNTLSKRVRWFLIALMVITFYVAIFQSYEWKSGWVPSALVVAILLGLRYRKLVVLMIPFVAIAAVFIAMDLIGAEDYSWGTRVDAWRIVLEIGRVSPLLGMGFANYYWYTPLFPIRGWRVSFNSHSQFVDLIAEVGYIGLLAFLWLFFEMGRLSWRVSQRLPDGFARGYSYGVFAGICASFVAAFLGDWVLPFVYNIGLTGFRASILLWIFVGGVMALEKMYLQDMPQQGNEVAISNQSFGDGIE